jgi:hypothetical protein
MSATRRLAAILAAGGGMRCRFSKYETCVLAPLPLRACERKRKPQLQRRLASFETRPPDAPQDDVSGSWH